MLTQVDTCSRKWMHAYTGGCVPAQVGTCLHRQTHTCTGGHVLAQVGTCLKLHVEVKMH